MYMSITSGLTNLITRARIEFKLDNENEIHSNSCCDRCRKHPIVGPRWRCDVCEDFDLCGNCFESVNTFHPGHQFTRKFPPGTNINSISLSRKKKDRDSNTPIKDTPPPLNSHPTPTPDTQHTCALEAARQAQHTLHRLIESFEERNQNLALKKARVSHILDDTDIQARAAVGRAQQVGRAASLALMEAMGPDHDELRAEVQKRTPVLGDRVVTKLARHIAARARDLAQARVEGLGVCTGTSVPPSPSDAEGHGPAPPHGMDTQGLLQRLREVLPQPGAPTACLVCQGASALLHTTDHTHHTPRRNSTPETHPEVLAVSSAEGGGPGAPAPPQ